jgi:hypothetical protein
MRLRDSRPRRFKHSLSVSCGANCSRYALTKRGDGGIALRCNDACSIVGLIVNRDCDIGHLLTVSDKPVKVGVPSAVMIPCTRALVPICLLTAACSGPPQTTKKNDVDNSGLVFDAEQAQRDVLSGKLKFEIRGLNNEVKKDDSLGSSSFTHTGVVFPVGDPKYSKGVFLLIYAVKRISGGDPEAMRKAEDWSIVVIRDGIGNLRESGGYRTKSEKWEPERIEVRPIFVMIGTPIDATPVQEK